MAKLIRVWSSEDAEKLDRAMQDGYNPNCYDNDGATALHRFAQKGWLKSLRILLKYSITCTDVLDHMDRTPLHYAATTTQEMFDQSLETTNSLLGRGLDIDAVSLDVECPTPLFTAIKHKNVGLTALLLKRGANIDIKNFSDLTPLMYLMVNHSLYEDSVLEELVSMLLYYNVDVNFSFNTHPFFIALLSGKEFLCDLLIGHFVGYDFLDCVDTSQNPFNNDFCTQTVVCCVENNYQVEKIINIVDKLNFETNSLIKSLLKSGELENSKLFNHFYDKLELRDIGIEDSKFPELARFFSLSKFNKIDFMNAVEKLFDMELGIRWNLHSMSESYSKLFLDAKPRLKLQLEDMEKILYQMFLVSNEINAFDLRTILETCLISHGFLASGFTDDFEIFLKIKIGLIVHTHVSSFPFGVPLSCDYVFFQQILFPDRQPMPKLPIKVNSLLVLSRDVIRRHLQPQVSVSRLVDSGHFSVDLFRYYHGVQRLILPQVLKDIIILKRQANIIIRDSGNL